MDNPGMMAAIAMAAGMTEAEAKKVVIDAAFIKKYLPAVAADLSGEGAKAEQARVQSIRTALAGTGHDAIIDSMIADPIKGELDALRAMAAADKTAKASQLAALDADEAKVKGLRSETANPVVPGQKLAGGLVGEAKWKAEWDGSEKLQAEFLTQADYVALMRAEAAGQIKRLKNRAA